MAPSRVTKLNFLAKWKIIDAKRLGVRVAKTKFRVGQHMRTGKEKMMLAKIAEKNSGMEIRRIAKAIEMLWKPDY